MWLAKCETFSLSVQARGSILWNLANHIVGLSSSPKNIFVVDGFSVMAGPLEERACGWTAGKDCRAEGWDKWGGIFLGGCFGALCMLWGCIWLMQLVKGVLGDLGRFLSTSSVSAGNEEKRAGLRKKVLDVMVVALLE